MPRVQRIQPAVVQRGTGIALLPGAIRQQLASQRQRLRQVNRDPAHVTVVDPPELGLEALSEGDYRAGGMPDQKPPHRLVECRHPDCVPDGTARRIREVVLEPVDDLDGAWVVQQRSAHPGCGRASAKVPQQRFWYARQVDPDALHPGRLTAAAPSSGRRQPRSAYQQRRKQSRTAQQAK